MQEQKQTVAKPNSAHIKTSRDVIRAINSFIKDNDELTKRYHKTRRLARVLRHGAVYDMTSRCNLWCEGCYFFEGEGQSQIIEEMSIKKWEEHFSGQSASGVTFGYFGGAEPGLVQDRVIIASEHIPFGTMATNGTLKIDPSIPYRLIVSVWGDEELTTKLRGGNTFWKAIRNFEGDDRALFAYTISNQNLKDVRAVAKVCRDHGIKLTFNMYSPTTSYLQKLEVNHVNDKEFFRVSTADNNLCFTDAQLENTRDEIDILIDDFPDTIVYPHAYNKEICATGPVFDISEDDGLALNCAGRHNGTHSTYLSNLEVSDKKCCTPEVSCDGCRQNAPYLPSRLQPKTTDVENIESFTDWLEICEYWAWFYINHQAERIVSK